MNMFRRSALTAATAIALLSACELLAHEGGAHPAFDRQQLSADFFAEGATFADFNNDGHADIAAGPYWYPGPKFDSRHEFYEPKPYDIEGYSDNFFAFAHDFNDDGWTDLFVIGFPGKEAYWLENPRANDGHWPRHAVFNGVDNESPTFADITGDGRPELVCLWKGQFGYAEIADDPAQRWTFRAVSPNRGLGAYTHGLGVGDVNNDGRADLLERTGWWEQPTEDADGELWRYHPFEFAGPGGAQMFAYDVDGDGDNDVVTSKAAHAYGLSWFEAIPDGKSIEFREHLIMGERPRQNKHGIAFSQLHAVALIDIDGDGVKDIVTGKRFWAHSEHDPGSLDPAVLYWFRTVRGASGVEFVPQLIDKNSGVGTQLVVGNINADERPDVVVSNKKGTFVFLQQADTEDHETSSQAQSSDAAFVSTRNRSELKPNEYIEGGLTPAEAVEVMDLPPGFSATVCAAEPDVKQPIAMTIDDRGRVWIAEAYEYPRRAPEGEGHDRVLIFSDTNGDGVFDERKVFAEGLNLVSGLEVGFGGVWVGAAPYLLFIPDRDGDDKPDGEPEVLLDGWGYQDTHETLNAFIWGPDGWLYGCHGVFTHSRVGKPGTPDDDRQPINAGIWRYHPTRHEFEVFAHGTSNPWGVDFDDHGQAFCTACVIPHLYHVIQGARYQRQAGQHFNRHTYAEIQTIADHRHYAGTNPHGGNLTSDEAGGGHAHAGAMIYLADVWPHEYRGQIFMNNIHGQRLNVDILKRNGSGFIGSHSPDFLLTNDKSSQLLNFRYGPDGNVYMIDWYDMQQCHHGDASIHDRSNGRIFKISYGDPDPVSVDLKARSDDELAELCLSPNEWYVRHARRILQERAAGSPISRSAVRRLLDIAKTHDDVTRRLRAVWALHVTGELTREFTHTLLDDTNEYVRGWAVQLGLESESIDSARLAQLADDEPSPVVRLYLASAAGRLPLEDRWDILTALVRHAADNGDHNLPLMYWYAAEPLAEVDARRALELGMACGATIPRMREFMIRRVAGLGDGALAELIGVLRDAKTADERRAILQGLETALEGRRKVDAPDGWQQAYDRLTKTANDDIHLRATALGVKFGDQSAIDKFRRLVTTSDAGNDARRMALQALVTAKDPALPPLLHRLTADAALRDVALRGLAQYDHPKTPEVILMVYSKLPPNERRAALATLCARPAYGIALLEAIVDEQIPISDMPADLVMQLRRFDVPDVERLIDQVWGQVRSTPEEKTKLIAEYKELLAGPVGNDADVRLGRAMFAKTCQQCHTLYGVGAEIGPDLTGSNRSDLDYLLGNVVDPNALIAKEYLSTLVITIDGRVATGLVVDEDDQSLTLRNATDTIVIPKDEIDERNLGTESIMPDDQLRQLSEPEVASLFTYLRGTTQSSMLATPDNAPMLFNGRDLAGWTGLESLWTVENGEIVGKTSGEARNEFLISDLVVSDFRLSLEVKLVDNAGNSGIQFRSRPIGDGRDVKGYQADIGVGYWGGLYDEHGRGTLGKNNGEQFIEPSEWNRYEIVARGSRVQTFINGHASVDLDDPDGDREGIIALQVHSGGPTEVRFRNLKLEVLGETPSQ